MRCAARSRRSGSFDVSCMLRAPGSAAELPRPRSDAAIIRAAIEASAAGCLCISRLRTSADSPGVPGGDQLVFLHHPYDTGGLFVTSAGAGAGAGAGEEEALGASADTGARFDSVTQKRTSCAADHELLTSALRFVVARALLQNLRRDRRADKTQDQSHPQIPRTTRMEADASCPDPGTGCPRGGPGGRASERPPQDRTCGPRLRRPWRGFYCSAITTPERHVVGVRGGSGTSAAVVKPLDARGARGTVELGLIPDPWTLGLSRPVDELPIADPVQLWLDCASEGERALEAADAVAQFMSWS